MTEHEGPDDIPEITDEMIEETRRLTGTWTVPLGGPPIRCPTCREEAMVASHDLVYQEPRPGLLLVVGGLSGYRCTECGNTGFDSRSVQLIEQHRNARPTANYEASVSRVGGSGIGVYFPKDLQRVMGIHAGQRAHITPMSDHTMLVELLEPDEAGQPRRKPRRHRPRTS